MPADKSTFFGLRKGNMGFREKLIICTAVIVISARPATAREIIVNAVCDIMLSGSGAATCKRLGYDYPFAATTAELKKGQEVIDHLTRISR